MSIQNQPVDWDLLYKDYLASRKSDTKGYGFDPPVSVLPTLAAPTPEDIEWLAAGLKDHRKWFVTSLMSAVTKISDVFLEPLLDAGIAEMEASRGPRYTLICLMQQFDPERMRNHLYSVIEEGDENQKAGAVFCLYGVGRGFGFATGGPEGPGTTDLSVQKHRAELLLQTFLGTKHRQLRCAILTKLPFKDIDGYPEELRPLVERVIASASDSEDSHERWLIRYRRARSVEEHNRIADQRPGPGRS